jgi:hypothetical protein
MSGFYDPNRLCALEEIATGCYLLKSQRLEIHMSDTENLIVLDHTSRTAPIAVGCDATVREMVLQASKLGVTLYNGQPIKVVLDDPDDQSLLDMRLSDTGLVQNGVLTLFRKPSFLVVIVNWDGQARYYLLSPTARVACLRLTLLLDRFDKSYRTGAILDTADFLITDTQAKVDKETPLLSLTTFPYRNVSLDLVRYNALRRAPASASPSLPEHIFRAHLRRGRFQSAVDHGYWRVVDINWPEVVIALRGRPRVGIKEATVRFKLDNYPTDVPTLELWNLDQHMAIPACDWPHWFNSFVVESYPEFASQKPQPYTPELLEISGSIARRRKRRTRSWNPDGDLTQVLIRLLSFFRGAALPQPLKPAPIAYSPPEAMRRNLLRRRLRFGDEMPSGPCPWSHGLFEVSGTHH